MNRIAPYAKTITALVAAAVTWGYAVVASPSGPITSSEWIGLAGALLTAGGVYIVTNGPAPVTAPNAPAAAPAITTNPLLLAPASDVLAVSAPDGIDRNAPHGVNVENITNGDAR